MYSEHDIMRKEVVLAISRDLCILLELQRKTTKNFCQYSQCLCPELGISQIQVKGITAEPPCPVVWCHLS
jgi:hypothetical protein